MNENDMTDYTLSLSPWINEYATPGPIVIEAKTASVKETESSLNDQAELYRKCQEEVLKKLAETPDKLGRSQMWKVNAIREDIANKRHDTGVMNWLVEEIIAMVEKES